MDSPNFFKKKSYINCRGKLIDVSQPKVMGIINVTPDSFYASSRVANLSDGKQRILEMVQQGADMIDVGAYSSRPGAEHIDEKQEQQRLEPFLDKLRTEFPDLVISLDTFRSSIAKWAVEKYQVDMINDISAGGLDAAMFETIAGLKVPYILMHMVGTPQNMQSQTRYDNLISAIISYFAQKMEQLNLLGVADVILDPGFGFSKNLDQNFELLARLDELRIFEQPLLVGLSRKSMIYKHLQSTPDEALNGTTVLNTLALGKGASILRVHDVKQARECVQLYQKTQSFQ
ncbi:MAG: dihydropteroate synthase [Bacteroidetes bacterium GWA2_40_14]|jgi:dihydropteroate synthase|nr:MAG: dihydropteroate synthase [Bacteroidetes bacterium GWA2_40_14]OFX61218.1 MAG: dihydropteroate synthase [Bacteroidetes bacterium GWC2_40_13]HAZ03832.1 dihydropteroate synthase [Marinilabiliales bacterium]HBO73548.1 dihydropteroate synthase [Marinilabiliales bacterium]